MVPEQNKLTPDLEADVEIVNRIEAVPTILDVVCRTTGMRFAAVARVTEERWIACSVLDEVDFGLKPRGELRIETTICNEIRQTREPVIINNVADDPAWRNHATPAMYGFSSYISMPIILGDNSFFGTLCAIDPRPARLTKPETVGMFRLFAELIAKHIDSSRILLATESALREERADADLREQFIAVLAHDLRTPMRSISCLMDLLMKTPLNDRAVTMARLMRESATRMTALIDNLLDLAHGRLGGGLSLSRDAKEPLEPVLHGIIAELHASQPDRMVEAAFSLHEPVYCDPVRIAQLFANLLGNAFSYGSAEHPIRVHASSDADHLELSVANAGQPIPQDAMERLFQPFYRSSVTRAREGLGLGLYIAHEIAIAHGGTLTVVSTAAETIFTLAIPVAKPNDAGIQVVHSATIG